MNAILEKLMDASARFEQVIFLAGALAAGDAMSDDLTEFFDYEDIETIENCLGEVPFWVNQDETNDIVEWLSNCARLGFLVKFATPVMSPSWNGSRSFSWGYYSTKWIYAETIDAAVEKGLAWVKECRASEDAEAGIA